MNEFFGALAVEFARLLGGFAGNTVAALMTAVLWSLFIFLCWGLPWSRIIFKAGYKGKAGRTMFLMLFLPLLIAPIGMLKEEIGQFLVLIAFVSSYLIIWFLALFPWRQVKPVVDKRA